jgi:single-stranded-DNA-specific exonuclease
LTVSVIPGREYLDLVALGIVADVASLIGDTRYLLQLGLRQLQEASRPALLAMLEIAEVKPGSINEETIAFVLAPRLNAVGRLSDANPIVEFFTSAEMSEARIQAQIIEGLNVQRKLLTDQVFKAAMSQVERDPTLLESSARC